MTPVLDLSEPAPEPYRKLVSVTPDNVLYQILNPCWENNNKDLFKEVFWELHSLFNPLNKDLPVGFPSSSDGKESACNSGDPGSIPGLGRSPGGGNGNPLQYSCLENCMDRGAWRTTVHGVAKSWARLKRLSTHAPGRMQLWTMGFPTWDRPIWA